jgi:hypothetical protein
MVPETNMHMLPTTSTAAAADATVTTKSSSSSLFGAVMKNVGAPLTPQKQHSTVLDFLNSVTSPFRFQQPSHTQQQQHQQSPLVAARSEWHETTVFNVTDWTLKQKLVLDCQPALFLGSSSVANARVVRQATSLFLTSETTTNTTTDSAGDVDFNVQWQSALFYWKYNPSLVSQQQQQQHQRKQQQQFIQPQPSAETFQTSTTLKPTSKSTSNMPPPHRPHAIILTRSQQRRDWQQAFQSLFFIWMQQRQDAFYARSHDHVALFRSNTKIVLSSCSDAFRTLLQARGVTIMQTTTAAEPIVALTETTISTTPTKSNFATSTTSTSDASPNLKAELDALRQSQVFGQTVGADVSILMKGKRHSVRSSQSARIPPLVIAGVDDCMAFYEVYYNCCGQVHTGSDSSGSGGANTTTTASNNNNDAKLPQLIGRKLGPFAHASLETLNVVQKRQFPHETAAGGSMLEVNGTILPCAMRELVCAAVAGMQHGEEHNNNTMTTQHNVSLFSPGGVTPVGSQHVIVRCTVQDGMEAASSLSNKLSNNTSKWMNDGTDEACCRSGEYLSVAVWDSSRPNTMTYKLDHAAGNLLG